ncbi:LysR family transcriptional regulator [Streptomyces luteolus]|uniref:LysR substrate-binding domain-containing protein n=1 Tax=Streptomyces luteolus TaxID=3043615 RepID=A0ABT6SQR5_9ACTN|nr:LysR substrate-binding domain-containing protein [Streptomyces sp. B-S-A12]MDI3417736.1 LysR substrate-binding domain-containing protein [Streptomyces sp. B-S-A12]
MSEGVDASSGRGSYAEPSVHQLRLFSVLAEELHFGRSAARLFMSQPAFSQQIRMLEQRLGLRLVERTTRRVELTSAGQALLSEARTVTAAMAGLRRTVESQSRAAAGRVVVGTLAAESAMPITRAILGEVHAKHPQLKVELFNLNFVNQYDALARGEVDIAFLRPPVPAGFQTLKLAEEPRVVCLPADDSLAEKDVLTLDDLSARTMTTMPPESPRAWRDFWAVNPRPDGVPIHFGPVAVDVEGVLHAVAHGQAIGILPASAREFYPRPGIRYRDIPGLQPCEMSLTWTARNRDRHDVELIRTVARSVLRRSS